MMRTLVIGAALALIAGAPARAADARDGRVGTGAWCDASWRGLNAARATHAESRRHYLDRCLAPCVARDERISASPTKRDRDYCPARWRDLTLARAAGLETYQRFLTRCGEICPAPGAATGSPVSAAAIAPGAPARPAILVPVLAGLAAGVVAAAAASSSQEDAPASP